MKGSMVDMYRQPDKLLHACDMMLDKRIANAVPATPENRGKRIGMPLWRGDKGSCPTSSLKSSTGRG